MKNKKRSAKLRVKENKKMEILQKHIEENEEIVNIIRFMIRDNMFNEEFVLTAILEYLESNYKVSKEEN